MSKGIIIAIIIVVILLIAGLSYYMFMVPVQTTGLPVAAMNPTPVSSSSASDVG